MAVKLAAAMGAEVTVLSRTLAKQEDGKRLGATHYFATQDEATFTDRRLARFDLIINTVSADLPMDTYMALLRPLGALVNVGPADQAVPDRARRPSSAAAARSPARPSAASPRPRRCSTSAPSTASGPRSRRSAPTRSTRPTTASSARDVRYRFVIDTATIKA